MTFSDNKIVAQQQAADVVDKCQLEARKMITENGINSADAAMEALQLLSTCVESKIVSQLEQANEEIAFQASVRKEVAEQLENYTCVDDDLDTSEDIEVRTWNHNHDGVERTVHVKHERPASRIHVVENFISEAECQAMEESASTTLHRATVADGKGGSQMSENRKAMQAGIKVNWEKEFDEEENMEMHIAKLSRRVYDYTNHVLGLNIQENGQEDLMSIQYFGRGLNDTAPDRYSKYMDWFVIICYTCAVCSLSLVSTSIIYIIISSTLRWRLQWNATQVWYSHGHHGHVLYTSYKGRKYQLSECWCSCQASQGKCCLF